MSQYPIETGDQQAIADGLNYVLSGPAGLGQNFSGSSSSAPAYLNTTVREPFTKPRTPPATAFTGPQVYVFYPINAAQPCDYQGNPVVTATQYVQFTFTTPFATVPYQFGEFVDVQGCTPSFYNGSYKVYSCTTTDIIVFTSVEYTYPAFVSGGELGGNWMNLNLSTDANGRVSVQGPTDRVFIAAQCDMPVIYYSGLNPLTSYSCTLRAKINRYTGSLDRSTGSTDYVFSDPVTIAEQTLDISGFEGTAPIDPLVTSENWIFTTVIDSNIDRGYYWYILEFEFDTNDVDVNGTPVEATIVSGTKVDTSGGAVSYTGVATTVNNPSVVTNVTMDIDLDQSASGPYTADNTTYTFVATNDAAYQLGDLITVAGTDLGGSSPANDLVLQITKMASPNPVRIYDVWLAFRSLAAQVVKE